MGEDHIQRRMDFIVEQQAKFSVDIELLTEAIGELRESVGEMRESIGELTEGQKSLTRDVRDLTGVVNILQSEMREGFNNLIVANEVTRKLCEEVAHLAINTSRRVSRLEERE
ncbi:MAG TPA: hypothetical protein VE262_01560 [Blastocatellia bacterium]|nr:hypothetical protein [Blastocatellia bacterium]